ncbi:MAG: ABC transporter ATP-binding protein [Thiohalophilus sp.]|uniref:ABC transporter ATP-binding protein n=1 Tax=Thiohalophilus sp. TaxID=3028392 RepID=UPI002870922C|nr:ABC transporter ATP-binding protein [Thiohalophilus sp.]MDR9437797.1 ABC transporter ATP-binding protein [Thiohalophilus sp.]
MDQPLLELKNIECRHRGVIAVENLNLHVNQGDLVCLLGPSGCGKTTVLRAIAGFQPLHRGEIRLREQRISYPGYTLAPEKRHIGMVFQDYALFPHLDVCGNITFGLRNLGKSECKRLANEMLEVVGLAGMGDRYIHELSGGQQQRVALARALAPRPELILMDEPFSNLDIDMRERLSNEVRQILKQQGTSGILVTHDQHEAFAMGDQISVMSEGHILQRDTAYNLYHSPANRFVADFIGQGVFVRGTLVSPETVKTALGTISGDRAYEWDPGTEVELLLRPDDIVYDPEGALQGKVLQRAFKGAEILYTLQLEDETEVLSLFPSHHDFAIGEQVTVSLALDHMVVFPL